MAGSARTGDIAGVYASARGTLTGAAAPAAAAVSAAIDHDLEAGARWFGLLSSQSAEPFYAGLGFVVVDHVSRWVLTAE